MASPTGEASESQGALARHLGQVVRDSVGEPELLYAESASTVRLNNVAGKDQELRDAVYVMTRTDIWAAGSTTTGSRRRSWKATPPQEQIGVIRVPYREIEQDVMHDKRPPYDYFAVMNGGMRSLLIVVASPQIAYATLATRNEA